MQILPISSIIISPNRQRREFSPAALEELQNSIKSKGLLHPIVVDKDNHLIAGERRLRAITALNAPFKCNDTEIPPGHIPTIRISDLPPDLMREAELEENIIRVDLTWQERTLAVAELFKIRSAENPNITRTNFATEIRGDGEKAKGQGISDITNRLILAQHLDDPDIKKAANVKAAMLMLKRKAHFASAINRGQAMPESEFHTIIHGDSFDLLQQAQDESFDGIITDPPYGLNMDKYNPFEGTKSHLYNDSPEYSDDCYELLAGEGFRILRPEGVLFTFCTPIRFEKLCQVFKKHNFTVREFPLIWIKTDRAGMTPDVEHFPQRTYEMILLATKGRPLIIEKRAADTFSISSQRNRPHPAAKPAKLYAQLLRLYMLSGMSVLDPFGGSGPLIPAGNSLGLFTTIFECDEEYVNFAKSRVKEHIDDPKE